MSVERNIKFDNDFVLLPETAPVEGEWVDIERSTLSPTTVTSSSGDMTPHATPPTAPPAADPLEGLDKLPEEKEVYAPRSHPLTSNVSTQAKGRQQGCQANLLCHVVLTAQPLPRTVNMLCPQRRKRHWVESHAMKEMRG